MDKRGQDTTIKHIYLSCLNLFPSLPYSLQQQVLSLVQVGIVSGELLQLSVKGMLSKEHFIQLTAFKFYAKHIELFRVSLEQEQHTNIFCRKRAWCGHCQDILELSSHIRKMPKENFSDKLMKEYEKVLESSAQLYPLARNLDIYIWISTERHRFWRAD